MLMTNALKQCMPHQMCGHRSASHPATRFGGIVESHACFSVDAIVSTSLDGPFMADDDVPAGILISDPSNRALKWMTGQFESRSCLPSRACRGMTHATRAQT